MKLILITFLFSSLTTLAASKVVEKLRVTGEKIASAHGCVISGEYTNSVYDAGEFKYTITMKIKIKQTQESYKVQVNKSFFGKLTETQVNNSTKPAADKIIDSSQSITRIVRADTPSRREELLKACEAEMLFINTGAYPPPPPLPPEPPKKEKKPAPVTPTTPTTPTIPAIPDTTIPILPDPIIPPASDSTNTLPGIPVVNEPLFPIDVPGTNSVKKKEEKKN